MYGFCLAVIKNQRKSSKYNQLNNHGATTLEDNCIAKKKKKTDQNKNRTDKDEIREHELKNRAEIKNVSLLHIVSFDLLWMRSMNSRRDLK